MDDALTQKLDSIDWDFCDVKQTWASSDIHALHWYPANFIAQIPAILLGALSNPDQIVLDPFFGCGTTLVEAARLGRRWVGKELTGMGFRIASAKMSLMQADILDQLEIYALNLTHLCATISNSFTNDTKVSISPEAADWFNPETYHQLVRILAVIRQETTPIRHVLEVLFSSMLITCCARRDHWGYIADNCKPRDEQRREHCVDAVAIMVTRLHHAIDAGKQFRRDCIIRGLDPENASQGILLQGSAKELSELADNSIDVIVTSPPYESVTDYTKAHRLSYLFLDLGEMKTFKDKEIGARWKRARPTRINDYLADMSIVFAELSRVLRVGGYLALVIGEGDSTRARGGVLMQLWHMLGNQLGFELQYRTTRTLRNRRLGQAGSIFTTSGVKDEEIRVYTKRS